ncbi:hypothetical protein N9B42_01550 [Akkermansiaceae bacterium]|nr:hypothetical protein [Akkermansiaceae bacterium]MDB0068411.1 hypothetical protein [Akkermansiaceae bacterium]MDB4434153.1 hypothetical protein [Akkermansiaceae bacterium]
MKNLPRQIEDAKSEVLAEGRHKIVVLSFCGEQCAVKSFGSQPSWKDSVDSKRGSKAQRSFEAAAHLVKHSVGTPAPFGYIDRWDDNKLLESYFLTEFIPDLFSLKDELIRIYNEQPECHLLAQLLETTATSLRAMHDSGFTHRDLGNQNIQLLRPPGTESYRVFLIDLNRGDLDSDLSEKKRADDLARLYLPSKFLLLFMMMYWKDKPSKRFTKYVHRAQRRFELWRLSRRLRHPFRPRKKLERDDYPPDHKLWLWDDKTAQPAIVLTRRDRNKLYPFGRNAKLAWSVISNAWKVWKNYRVLQKDSFSQRVRLEGRIGMALETTGIDFSKQLIHLGELGPIPVLIRFCHHEGMEQWQKTVAHIDHLTDQGHEVFVALVQDREAFLNLDSWERMCRLVLEQVGSKVSMVEICHAVNRTKWGLHTPEEQNALLERIVHLRKDFPDVPLSGPACIDFEYYHVLRSLDQTPKGLHYSSLSHHLYVDRRGSPENEQLSLGIVGKSALLKAVARSSSHCDDRVIISEVNWPLKSCGIWSPVNVTYRYPGQPESALNVSEEDYGYFMLRYLVLTLCSGHIEKVYWWRLVSHGFGLVDERAEGGWRARPGFAMLKYFLKTLGNAVFTEKLETEEDVYALRFDAPQGEVIMAWANGKTAPVTWEIGDASVCDVFGNETAPDEVGDAPVYFLLSKG